MSDVKAQVQSSMGKSVALAKSQGTMAGYKQQDILGLLEKYKGAIAQALPKHLTAERIIQISSTLISRNPKIAKCSISSLIGAVMQASILGLKPVAELGHCYFVPYNNKVKDSDGNDRYELQIQFQIGYKGYLELARRSGQIKMVYAEVVREGDEFSYCLGLNPNVTHVPNQQVSDGKITHAYAVVHYKDGGYNFSVITRSEIESYRKRNKMQGNAADGAWGTDFPAMAKKTAIRRLAPYLPLDTDYLQSSIGIADENVVSVEDYAKDQSGVLDAATVLTIEVVDEGTGEVSQSSMFPGDPSDYTTDSEGNVVAKKKKATKQEENAIYE